MTYTTCYSAIAGVMAAAFGLATLSPAASNEALAQGLRARGITQSYYYGYGTGYNSRYYNAYGGSRYGSAISGYGYSPYGYGTSALYGYPSNAGYGYGSRASYNLYFGGLRSGGRNYRSIYNPYSTRAYRTYGYGGY